MPIVVCRVHLRIPLDACGSTDSQRATAITPSQRRLICSIPNQELYLCRRCFAFSRYLAVGSGSKGCGGHAGKTGARPCLVDAPAVLDREVRGRVPGESGKLTTDEDHTLTRSPRDGSRVHAGGAWADHHSDTGWSGGDDAQYPLHPRRQPGYGELGVYGGGAARDAPAPPSTSFPARRSAIAEARSASGHSAVLHGRWHLGSYDGRLTFAITALLRAVVQGATCARIQVRRR